MWFGEVDVGGLFVSSGWGEMLVEKSSSELQRYGLELPSSGIDGCVCGCNLYLAVWVSTQKSRLSVNNMRLLIKPNEWKRCANNQYVSKKRGSVVEVMF